MKIKSFRLGMVQTNCYLCVNEEINEAIVVDPGDAPESFMNALREEGCVIKGIFLTHGHFDHITGVKALVEQFHAPVYALEQERELLATSALNLSTEGRIKVEIEEFEPLVDGQEIEAAGMNIRVIATPGHTAGGACYYVEKRGVLFSGDTIFHESIGRTDFPTGDHMTLIQSIKEKVFALPEDTIIYAGHMSETTVAHEKQYNPYMR